MSLTRDSIAPPGVPQLEVGRTGRPSEWVWDCLVFALATVVVATSIVMFLMGNSSEKLAVLITQQNEAALKLWGNLDYFQHEHAKPDAAKRPLPPGLFESLVEFSRRNATIIKTANRLELSGILSYGNPLDEIVARLKPTHRLGNASASQPYFQHSGVAPMTDGSNVVKEGMYQIELYQAIRDYAQDKSGFYMDRLGAISTYVLPVLYAVLGAFLWAIRVPNPAPAKALGRLDRLAMAAVAGIAISALSTLAPRDPLLSPLAIAFLIGYSIDSFTRRLDAFVERLSGRK